MIRKGLRPRFKFGLDLLADTDSYRKVMPFRRSWIAIAILAAFDIVFLIPAITTFQQASSEWGSFDDLFDLVGALFLSAWLLGWSIGPILMTGILALMLFGREVIKARTGAVEIFIGLPFVGITAAYEAARMRNLRRVLPRKKSPASWRGDLCAFDYGANTVEFGSDISDGETAALASSIHMASGKAIRRGDALPEELEGKWKTSDFLSKETAPMVQSVDSALAANPVTLSSPSTLALIIANLIPLAGAAFMGWDLSDVMVLYWAESAVIGFFNLCKIIVIGRWFAVLAGAFFLGHFGAFMAVHFLFIYAIFVQGLQNDTGSFGELSEVAQLFIGLWPALLALFVSHAFSFYRNFLGRQEYRGRTVQNQMSEPYSRIIFMHLVLIFGGGLSLFLGEPAPVLIIVIGLKIWFDVKAHLKQRHAKST
jgi:hypothetical protein